MRIIEVADLRLAEPRDERLMGAAVDWPGAGARGAGETVEIAGWALGRGAPVVAVEILHSDMVIRRTPVQIYRPDIAAIFPEVAGATHCGFRAAVGLPGAAPPLELELRAVLADGRRVPLGALGLRWYWWEEGGRDGVSVSVIIRCADQAHLLGEAIESAACQTFPGAEIVVVDDGSADNTAAVAARYPAVRYVRQRRRGLAGARNAGIRQSNGAAIVFLDASDRLLPHALEAGLEALSAHPEAAFVYGRCRPIAFDGAPLLAPPHASADDEPYAALLRGGHIETSAVVMYRRVALRALGGFDPAVSARADDDLYLRMARRAPVVCHGAVVAEHRACGVALGGEAALLLRAHVRMLRRHRHYVQSRPAYGDAYKSGLRRVRVRFGEPLAEVALARLRARDWSGLPAALLTLVRYNPRALIVPLFGSVRLPLSGLSLLSLARAARGRARRLAGR